jgi:catechol 2,3-dioxygenase-like lactoylglutathione lyase family enzyme
MPRGAAPGVVTRAGHPRVPLAKPWFAAYSQSMPDADSQLIHVYHTGFTVANMERALTFYRDLLGMVVIAQQEGQRPYLAEITGFKDIYLKTSFLKVFEDQEHVLELLEYTSHPGEMLPEETNRPGNAHLCFRVRDIQAVYAKLSANGVRFVNPPTPVTSGLNQGAVACYLRDFDNHTIELIQPAPPR